MIVRQLGIVFPGFLRSAHLIALLEVMDGKGMKERCKARKRRSKLREGKEDVNEGKGKK